MQKNTRVALLLFSFSKDDSESIFFLENNNIPSQIDVFDCRWNENEEFNVSPSTLQSQFENVFDCQTSIKSNGLLMNKIFELGYSHIIYSHHDSFEAEDNCFYKILDICNELNTSNLGVIGFNILHDNEITSYLKNETKYGTLCRTILQKGNGYFNLSCLSSSKLHQKTYIKPFVIEIPMWSICLITRESFEKIKYAPNFEFHLEFDDISFNFMKNNIPNICIPSISFFHQQSTSPLFGRAYKSPMSEKQKKRLDIAHRKWKSIWMFDFGVRKSRKSFTTLVLEEILSLMNLHAKETIARTSYKKNNCYKLYKNTLIDLFYSGYFSYIEIPKK